MNFENPELLKAETGCSGAHHGDGPADLSFLDGKKIIRTGYIHEMREGGLAIDYDDDGTVRRVVFGYNDFGLWVVWKGEPGKLNEEDILKAKIESVEDRLCEMEKIVSNPLKRSYSFVDGDDVPILTLSMRELRLMGENVVKNFSSLPLNAEKILLAITLWAVG